MENEIKCSINLEWTNKQGAIQRKVTHKLAVLKLIRNASKDMYIEVNPDKSPATQRLHLKNIAIFNKFMQEGKASIKFNDISCSLYISNAPPGQLSTFFRTLFVKIIGYKQDAPKTSLRTQVLTNRTQQYNEISPVTNGELERVIKATTSKSTTTTPSPLASKKRKIERDDDSRAAKKLFASSPLPEELTIEQKEILDACLAGNNIFFTGSAGTGKSYLLKKIIQSLPPDLTMATASTGVAACHIGGTTLHQFAGIGTGEGSLEHCLKLANRSASITWRRCKHLIIDEISMVEGSYFDKIDQVAKAIRKNEKPFGGIQLILCGDFLQLPPVMKASQAKNFCFQTKAWQNCRLMTMELKQVHRQTDNKFISVLNKIRVGQVDDNIVKILKATSSQKIEKDGILATTLCSLTRDVDALNNAKLNELKGETKIFQADDSMVSMSKQLDQLTNIPYKIDLKIGAQVMLLKNISVSKGLVNGARGVVKSFKDGFPMVQFRNKTEFHAKLNNFSVKMPNGSVLVRKQIPLKLAWAFSIHKSQGLTLDCVEMSLARVFEAGQAYVALSRAQSLETLRILDFKSTQVWANPDVLKFYESLNEIKYIPLGPTTKSKERTIKNVIRRLPSKSKMFDKPLMNIN